MTISVLALAVALLVALIVFSTMEFIVIFMDIYDEEMGDNDEYNNKV